MILTKIIYYHLKNIIIDDIKNKQALCIPCHTWKSRYIDTNYEFNNYIEFLKKQKISEDLFYICLIKKMRYIHSLKTSKCSCKVKYLSMIDTIKDEKTPKTNRCFSFLFDIFK